MSIYIKALRRAFTDPEFSRFLLYSGMFYKYLKAARMLDEYTEWYEHKLLDLCLERIYYLDDIIATLAEILAHYLAYINTPQEKIQNIVKAFVDFASLTRAKAEYTYELLISKTRGERAQLAAIHKILFHIGETIDILRKFFEESLENIINYILIRRRHTLSLVDKVSMLSKKLKKLEEEAEGIVIETAPEEITPIEQKPEEQKVDEKYVPEVPREVLKEIESEMKTIVTKQEAGLLSDKELSLLMTLVEMGCIDWYPIDFKNKIEVKMGMPWSQIKKLAYHINLKLVERYGVPLIRIKEDGLYIVSQFVEMLKEHLRSIAPSFLAAYEEKASSRSEPLK